MLRHCAYIVTFVPSVLRWRLAETKPGARRTETSVASVRSSTSRRWFAGSTVNTLIRVITSLFAEIVVIVSLPFREVEIRPELRCCRTPAIPADVGYGLSAPFRQGSRHADLPGPLVSIVTSRCTWSPRSRTCGFGLGSRQRPVGDAFQL